MHCAVHQQGFAPAAASVTIVPSVKITAKGKPLRSQDVAEATVPAPWDPMQAPAPVQRQQASQPLAHAADQNQCPPIQYQPSCELAWRIHLKANSKISCVCCDVTISGTDRTYALLSVSNVHHDCCNPWQQRGRLPGHLCVAAQLAKLRLSQTGVRP